MMKIFVISVFLTVIPSIISENVFRINITPEEAQQYLQQANLNIDYAPKTGENPLPATRNANGEFIYQGRKIENPSDYVEEHYNANQYHGQDGLGRYIFGYSDWNQGRVEAKNAEGEIRGSYQYVDGNGRDYRVNYWADSLGFHQEDNRPKEELQPVTDTPEVKAAKEEHLRLWRELAAQNGVDPDAQQQQDENDNYHGEGQYVASGTENQYNHVEPKYVPGPEEATAEPKGFFYSFDYSVPLLRNLQEREETERLRSLNRNTRSLKESEPVAVEAAAVQKDDVVKERLTLSRAAAVHDVQVNPRTRTAAFTRA